MFLQLLEINRDVIIEGLAGATIVAVGVYEAVAKVFPHFGVFKKKIEERKTKETEEKKVEFSSFTKDVVVDAVHPMLEELKDINDVQSEQLEKLMQSSNDILRKDITDIYYKYLPQKRLPNYVKQELTLLYHDYKKQGGNSFIEEIMNEMRQWEVTSSGGGVK